MKHDTPALPVSPEIWASHPDFHGLTKRELFAGMALGEFASLITVSKPETLNVVAALCFQMADAMIAASTKGIDDDE